MFDPFELHPEDKQKMSKKKKKEKQIEVKKVKKILKDKLKNIQKLTMPLWGYNSVHIRTFIYDMINEIKIAAGEEDDC